MLAEAFSFACTTPSNVDARKAYENGIEFYQANRSFWLVTALPKEFLVNV
jgi:RNA:NAD 2'-phosphotransferase (TPT1/KptA family)